MPRTEFWDLNAGVPPALTEIAGLPIERAWVLPGNKTLIIRLQGMKMVMLSGQPVIGEGAAVSIEIGDERIGAKWDDLDEMSPQDGYTKALRGKCITGMDGNTIVFDLTYGVELNVDGIRWVRIGGAGGE